MVEELTEEDFEKYENMRNPVSRKFDAESPEFQTYFKEMKDRYSTMDKVDDEDIPDIVEIFNGTEDLYGNIIAFEAKDQELINEEYTAYNLMVDAYNSGDVREFCDREFKFNQAVERAVKGPK